MKSLLLPRNLKLLQSLVSSQTLFAFDFDGTLSKIVASPSNANLSGRTRSLLQKFSKQVSVVVISGRNLADLKTKLNVPSARLVGSHGLEGVRTAQKTLQRAEANCQKWKKILLNKISKQNHGVGIELEDKMYSLALHYRRSGRQREAQITALKWVTTLSPIPRIIPGKGVLNLLPPGAPHKGVALLELMQHIGMKSALYVGDDDTDEDVFALTDANIFTIRVGKKRTSRAQYFIPHQADINRLLSLLMRSKNKNRLKDSREKVDM